MKGVFKIKNLFKNTVIHLRTGFKFTLLLLLGIALALFLIFVVYKPMYSVSLNGNFLGYTSDKSELQSKINEYITSGNDENIAFVEIDTLPDYEICLLKKGLVANDEEILSTVINTGTPYYKYYAILDNGTEKCHVKTFNECEDVINKLKDRESSNKDSITYIVKYETQFSDIIDTETAVAKLYVEPKANTPTPATAAGKPTVAYKNSTLGLAYVQQPVSGSITSRFGARSKIRSSAHTGLDVANSLGTPFTPIAPGTVTFASYKGSYGYLIIIDHGLNSEGKKVESYYAHCSKMNVSVGQTVDTNTVIGNVGSSGNSTGPHLHLEIRINGSAVNPQNYLYK